MLYKDALKKPWRVKLLQFSLWRYRQPSVDTMFDPSKIYVYLRKCSEKFVWPSDSFWSSLVINPPHAPIYYSLFNIFYHIQFTHLSASTLAVTTLRILGTWERQNSLKFNNQNIKSETKLSLLQKVHQCVATERTCQTGLGNLPTTRASQVAPYKRSILKLISVRPMIIGPLLFTSFDTFSEWRRTDVLQIFSLISVHSTLLNRVHTVPEKFKNAALFPRLGLPFTLIRHENGAFWKPSSNRRNFKTPALSFRVDVKHFENGAFRKRWRHANHVISQASSDKSKIDGNASFSPFYGVVQTWLWLEWMP